MGMNNGYCEKHERPYQFFCICGDWRYECPQCRYEGVYDTVATTQTKMNPANEWTASDKVEGRRRKMTETDKLLIRIGTARDAISRKTEQTSLDYMIDGVLMNCSALLKEQEAVTIKKTKEHGFGVYGGICPKCRNWIQSAHSFCGFCGQAVKWE